MKNKALRFAEGFCGLFKGSFLKFTHNNLRPFELIIVHRIIIEVTIIDAGHVL